MFVDVSEQESTAPSFPNIALQTPASSPGTNDAPAFTVTVDGGSNFTTADWSRVDLYASQDCSGSSIASNAALSGTDTSVILTAGSSIGGSGTYRFSIKASDAFGNTVCSNDEAASEADLDFETYVLDVTNLSFPNLVIQIPAPNPGSDNTPAFTVTVDGGANFTTADWTRVDLYASQDCSGSSIANNASLTGTATSVILTAGSSIGSSGTYEFSVKATDDVGNTACSYDDANSEADLDFETYELDVTNPSFPNIVLQTPASSPGSDNTPAFTVSVDGGANFTTADWSRVDLYASQDCSGSSIANNAALTGTDTSVILTAGSSIGASGTYEFSIKATDDVGNTVCSNDEAASEADLDFETYELDVTAPSFPNIVLQAPASSPGTDNTPAFTVTVDGGSNFTTADWSRVDLYASQDCSGSSIANNAALTGTDTSVILTAGSSIGASGTYEFSVKATDDVGNTVCSNDEAASEPDLDFETYVLDVTAPSFPNIVLQIPAPNPGSNDTPAFTVTVDGGPNFTTADWSRVDLYASQDCSGSSIANNAALTGTDTSVILTAGSSIGASGTYEFSIKATDDVGNTVCSNDEAASEADLDFETYELDATAPSFPNIVLQTPASSPGSDNTPAFTVSVDGGANFTTADWSRVDLYASQDCSGSSIANNAALTGTDTSVILTAGSSIGASGTYEFSIKATDSVGNTVCSNDEAASEPDLDFETYVLDVTAPSFPNIVLQIPAPNPGSNDTPAFTVTVDGGSNFTTADWSRVDLYASQDCSGSSIANNASLTGTDTSVILTAGSSIGASGTYEFSIKATDDVGNTVCSNDEAASEADLDFETYELDATAPSFPSIVLQTPASSPGADDTPAFTVTVDGGSDFTTADWSRVDLYASQDCSGSSIANNASLTGTDTSVILTAGSSIGASGTYEFSIKATDPVGNTVCSNDEAASEPDLDFETYVLDVTAPSAPEIVLKTPATSLGNDSTPEFTVSFENNSSFLATDTITLHAGTDCSGPALSASVTSQTGTSVDVAVTSAQSDGASLNYYAKVVDQVGNVTCSTAHSVSGNGTSFATYAYDGTPPDVPEIMIAIPGISPSTDSTPSFTVSFELNGNYTATDKITIHNNNTCTSAVSGTTTGQTGASVNVEITSAQTADTSVNYYARVEDAAGNASCSVTHATDADGFRYATHVYDATAPTAPEIDLKVATTPTPSQDDQPVFTISLDDDDTFENHGITQITLHEGADCSGAAVATLNSPTGTSIDITRDASATQQSTVYRAKVRDAASNTTCSTAHVSTGDNEGEEFATHLYDNTAPTWADSLILASATSSSTSETPVFTYASDADDTSNGSGIDEYQYAIDEKSGTCDSSTPDTVSWTTAPTTGNSISGLSLTNGGTYCFMMRATDNVGLASSVIRKEWTVVSLIVAARYGNAPQWMDYVRTSDYTTACDGTESARSACHHGGEHRKVIYDQASVCTGLSMTDALGAFDWSCTETGANITFYGSLKSAKRLKDLIDFDGDVSPEFFSNSVTLIGCVGCPKDSLSEKWWTNSVTALPNNSGGSGSFEVLSSSGTIYTLDSTRTTAGYGINASKIGVVIDDDAELQWDGGLTVNGTYCGGVSDSCLLGSKSSTARFLWIDGSFNAKNGFNRAKYGIYLSGPRFVKTDILTITEPSLTGLYLNDTHYSQFGSIDIVGDAGISSLTDYGIRLDSGADIAFGNIDIDNAGDGSSDQALSCLGTAITFSNINTRNNSGDGLYMGCSASTLAGTVTSTGNTGDGVEVASTNNTFSGTLTISGNTGKPLLVSGGSNSFSDDINISSAVADSNLVISGSSNTFSGAIDVGSLSLTATSGICIDISGSSNTFNDAIYLDSCSSTAGAPVGISLSGNTNTLDSAYVSNVITTVASEAKGILITGNGNKLFGGRVTNVQSGNSVTKGILLDGPSNILFEVSVYNIKGTGIGINPNHSGNKLILVTSANNSLDGIIMEGASATPNNSTIFLGVTTANNGADGLITRVGSNSVLSSILSLSNSLNGIVLSDNSIHSNTGLRISNLVAMHNSASNRGDLYSKATQTSLVAAGFAMIGSSGRCEDNTTPVGPFYEPNCTFAGTDGTTNFNGISSGTLTYRKKSAITIVGKVGTPLSDSANVHSIGTATYTDILDWFNFENIMRFWGKDGSAYPASNNRGNCTTGTCRIWDFSISSSDTIILNKSGDGNATNDAFVNLMDCPSQVSGNETVGVLFLRNAYEIVDDGIGDNDGLCESSEACVYMPNVGAYQGHGTLNTCVFQDGTIFDVTMYGHSSNGR
jgi:hypothetical protein